MISLIKRKRAKWKTILGRGCVRGVVRTQAYMTRGRERMTRSSENADAESAALSLKQSRRLREFSHREEKTKKDGG